MEEWLKKPKDFLPDLKPKMVVTLYGPYGKYTLRMEEIASYLRNTCGYENAFLVKDRKTFRRRVDGESYRLYMTRKSYHFVENSNVNIFIFLYGAHNDSLDFEFKHMCDKCQQKITCSVIFLPETKDYNTKISTLLEGQVEDSSIRTYRYPAVTNPDQFIKDQLKGICDVFLFLKTREIIT